MKSKKYEWLPAIFLRKAQNKLRERFLFRVISRVSRAIFLILMLPSLATAELYHTNRTFSPIEFNIQGTPTADQLNKEAKKMEGYIAPGAPVKITSSNAIERQIVVGLGYDSGISAWDAVTNCNIPVRQYPGKMFNNVGWVRGTKSAEGKWGAFIWTLQNQIAFKSSETNRWPFGGGQVLITNVIVGSLGDYQPLTPVSDTGPKLDWALNTYPGDDDGDEGDYQVDLTTYYQLAIPEIAVMPKEAVTVVGGNAVQFTATGTNIPSGVTWMIDPEGDPDGATLAPYGNIADVTPGNVPMIYKIYAISVDCPNLYDEAKLTVVRVEIKKPAGDPVTEPNANNERTYNSANPGIGTVVCEAEDTPNADKLRWTIEDVGEIQATWEPHVDGNPHIGKGLNPTATFMGLPAQYNAFGSKTITLTMDEPGITASDTQEAEIFFPRSAANHPFEYPWEEGPNWYYYSLQILPCVADIWRYRNTSDQPSWSVIDDPDTRSKYAIGRIEFTDSGCPGNPFYYIAHENKHHTDFFQEIWQGTGYEGTEDEDEDGIRDDFEIDHYGNLDKTFDYIMQEDWSESRANTAGNAASGDTSNWNKYWCDPGTLKGFQP